MSKTEREEWWDSLTAEQRVHLLKTAKASDAQIVAFKSREWYQLSKWVRKAICALKPYQLAVPLPKEVQL
jgi:hypothetical protein